MSQRSKKTITLQAKRPSILKTALKTWVGLSEKDDGDPFQLDKAPVWAENALAEVVKTVLPRRRLLTEGEWDSETIGELLGRQQAFAKLFSGEIPMGSQMKAEIQRLNQIAASQPKSRERSAKQREVKRGLQTMMGATAQAIPLVMTAAIASSHEDALKFQKGLSRGMRLAPDELNVERLLQRHTRTFWVLGLQWRRFCNCRSVAEVHRKLCSEIGEEKIGDLKTFQNRVAKKIGMRFRRSGRPRKRE